MKKELNMPKTNFTQRSEAKTKEPQLLKLWENVMAERNDMNDKKLFVLHTGPAFSNGNSHLGHLLNLVLKDMSVKYKMMDGHKVDLTPGFDCHGLPTELAVLKKYGKLDKTTLREKCSEMATYYAGEQTKTLKSFGVLGNWETPYMTMNYEYETKQLEVLYKFLNDGLLFMDERPVYYSPSSRTVLAEAELEYKNRKDMSAYFTFDAVDGRKLLHWTTQPWTVLGNVASCVNPHYKYVDVELDGFTYVVLENKKHLLNGVVVKEYYGRDLEGLEYTNELNDNKGRVLCDEFVRDDSGTGLVHLCPGHGEEDYEVCKRNGLVGYDLTDSAGRLENGLFCLDKGSEYVLDKMGSMLFKKEEYEHSYPHDWRTGGPVYYKMTEQFFLNLTDLREQALLALEDVEFSDNRWKNRLVNMLKTRDRWCLSRQRTWGFPLAVFLKDGKPFYNEDVRKHLDKLFKENGSNVWFDKDENYLLPESYRDMGLVKCDYTMDVWFDSGVSWYSVVGGQSDVYVEGSDQCRGWFQSSLLTSVAMTGKAPYKKLVAHGFVLDENGRKMSKSLGNVVDPKEVQDKYNSDVFRLWVSSVNYSDDVQFGDTVLKSCGDYYFKLRNTLRYLLGNMYEYKGYSGDFRDKDLVAMKRCDSMYKNVLNGYASMEFKKSFQELMNWVNDFSSQYLDLETKSHLYEYDTYSEERQRCQYVLKYSLERFMKALAPMCSFLAEDAYQNYPFKKNKSVFLELY